MDGGQVARVLDLVMHEKPGLSHPSRIAPCENQVLGVCLRLYHTSLCLNDTLVSFPSFAIVQQLRRNERCTVVDAVSLGWPGREVILLNRISLGVANMHHAARVAEPT